MRSEQTTCVVVGGGPAGMFLGLMLARAGIEVTVLEKHPDFLRDFRGDTVHPSTLQLLQDLGLSAEFNKLPYSVLTHQTVAGPDGVEQVGGDFTRLPGNFQYMAMVPQWDLLDMLAEAGRAEPTFTLRMNTAVTDVVTEHGRVVGVRYVSTEDGPGEVRAELTVATDGRHSTLRRAAKLRVREFPVPMDAWWFRLPRREDDPSDLTSLRVRDRQASIALGRQDYYQVVCYNPKGFDPTLRAQGLDRFRERFAALNQGLADRMDALTDLDEVKFLDVRLNRCRRWFARGLLCIGDAAHAMSPVGGVGINLAIQDATTAARVLAAPLRRRHVRLVDLIRIQARRWLPVVIVQMIQRLLNHAQYGPMMQGTNPRAATMYGLARRIPAVRDVQTYLMAIGLWSERAPVFARRAPAGPVADVADSSVASSPDRSTG